MIRYVRLAFLLSIVTAAVSVSNAQESWVRVLGGPTHDEGTYIRVREDGHIVVTGVTSSRNIASSASSKGDWDYFLLNLDSFGRSVSSFNVAGTGMEFITETRYLGNDRYALLGSTSSIDGAFALLGRTSTFSATKALLIVDSVGKPELGYDLNIGGSCSALSLATLADRSIVLGNVTKQCGILIDRYSSIGDVIWSRKLGSQNDSSDLLERAHRVEASADNGFFVTGKAEGSESILTDGENRKVFLVKHDLTGAELWKSNLGGSYYEWGSQLAALPDGGAIVAGLFAGSVGDFDGLWKGAGDVFVARYSTDGKLVWLRTFGGSGQDEVMSIALDQTGESIALTGYTTSYDGDFKAPRRDMSDVFVMRLDMDGNVDWIRTFGGSMEEQGMAIVFGRNKGLFVTGSTTSNDGLFTGLLVGGADVFVMKLDSNGLLSTGTSIENVMLLPSVVRVYPNPVTSIASVSLSDVDTAFVSYELSDALGRIVLDGTAESCVSGQCQFQINLGAIESGAYQLKLWAGSIVAAVPLVLAR